MPCYNAAQHVHESINSVLAQSFVDWELIAINDGSNDDTLDILETFQDPRIAIINQSNQGVSQARNNGIAQASGEYIAFLDTDDRWENDFLEEMHTALQNRPNAILAYCGWQNHKINGADGDPFIPPDYENSEKMISLFSGCRWPIHAVLCYRKLIIDAGGFNPQLKNSEDYSLWLEVANRGEIAMVPRVLAHYYFHSDTQASANRERAALQFLSAQLDYLDRHPDFAHQLGDKRVRELIYGPLLEKGMTCYWNNEIEAARKIFRIVMMNRYGSIRDWKYMLPALLPLSVHRNMLKLWGSMKTASKKA